MENFSIIYLKISTFVIVLFVSELNTVSQFNGQYCVRFPLVPRSIFSYGR